MSEFAVDVFQNLTGREPSDQEKVNLVKLQTPSDLRSYLVRSEAVHAAFPELRLAHEIIALRNARENPPIKLVIGAASTRWSGWTSTNRELLDLLNPEQWRAWLAPDSVSNILAEHVWEHLDFDEGLMAARTCQIFLKPGGRLRIAVPDAYFPDKKYYDYCKPGSYPGHKVFYNHETLCAVLTESGLTPHLLEYFDKNGEFHGLPWDSSEGHISRSRHNDRRNTATTIGYMSIIVDAMKSA